MFGKNQMDGINMLNNWVYMLELNQRGLLLLQLSGRIGNFLGWELLTKRLCLLFQQFPTKPTVQQSTSQTDFESDKWNQE